MAPGYTSQPMMSGMPMTTNPNVMTTTVMPGTGTTGSSAMNGCWPSEWKDPSEWTVRDFNRLGEIMDEYLNRQRGRGHSFMPMKGMNNLGMMREEPWSSRFMGMPSEQRRYPSQEIEQLQAQMMRYVEESKQQMQAMSDFLYGSERERREEMYKDRQRKMIEEILKNMLGSNRLQSSPISNMRSGGNNPYGDMLGSNTQPFMPFGHQEPGMMTGHPMNMMGGMHPFQTPMGMDPSMTGPNDWTASGRGMPMRPPPRRRRGIGFSDDPNDEFDRRRPRKSRFGFDDDPDDIFHLGGDGMYVSLV